jgi:hypothetical protein
VDQESEQWVVAKIGHRKKPMSMAKDAGFWYQNLPANSNRAKTGFP